MSRTVILILSLVLLFFSPVLLNGFCGDDNGLFVENSFYKDLANLPRVFNSGYNISGHDMLYSDLADKGSGSVAYRPVTTLSFFLDTALWGSIPAGFHLTSLLLHLINVLLLYRIVAFLFNWRTALTAALIFGLHPVNSEAVAAIAYRSDLLVTFFVLAGSWAWISLRRQMPGRALALCAAAYGLALFSKETAILFPLVLWVLAATGEREEPIQFKRTYYIVFPLLACFYLYLYFFVFPNKALGEAIPMIGTTADHAMVFVQTMGFYLKQVFWPFSAGVVPALYSFLPAEPLSWSFILQALSAILFLAALLGVFRLRPRYAWLSLWVILFLLPPLIPGVNPNPVALRYLYLPFAGGAILLAIGILHLWDHCSSGLSPFMRRSLCVAGIIALGGAAFLSNLAWKNNFSIGNAWIRYYPDHYMGYGIRGTEFFRQGMYEQSEDDLEAALKDPRCDNLNFHYLLGFSYLFQKKEQKAQAVFQELLKKAPFFDKAYLGMAFYYYGRKQYVEATPFFQRVFILAPNDANNALNFLKAAARAEGPKGVERGLLTVERVWGKGPAFDDLKELSVSFSEEDPIEPASF